MYPKSSPFSLDRFPNLPRCPLQDRPPFLESGDSARPLPPAAFAEDPWPTWPGPLRVAVPEIGRGKQLSLLVLDVPTTLSAVYQLHFMPLSFLLLRLVAGALVDNAVSCFVASARGLPSSAVTITDVRGFTTAGAEGAPQKQTVLVVNQSVLSNLCHLHVPFY